MTVDGYTLGVARQAQQSAANWKAYAEELERKLATYAANYVGMEALKNAAVAELSRVDPSNYLTVQSNGACCCSTASHSMNGTENR